MESLPPGALREFGPWHPLDDEGLTAAPDAPGAIQVCRADRSLVQYPSGKSAMVFYVYAARSVRDAMRKLFGDELDTPGARGEGPLAFRWCAGGDDAECGSKASTTTSAANLGGPRSCIPTTTTTTTNKPQPLSAGPGAVLTLMGCIGPNTEPSLGQRGPRV